MPSPFWHPISASSSWLEHCHGFVWLRDLRAYANGSDRVEDKYRAVRFSQERLSDWLSRNKHWTLELWQPSLVRHRLMTLLCHYDWYGSAFSTKDRLLLHRSLYGHYRHLRRVSRLESASSEERLLSLILCVISGLCFGDQRSRLRSDERKLCETLEHQVPRGAGFWVGRKADTHLEIMSRLLEAKSMYGLAQVLPPEGLLSALDRMVPALKMLRSADGGLSTFQGSCESNIRAVSRVLSGVHIRAETPLSSRQGGIERLSGTKGVLLLDSASSGLVSSGRHASPSAIEFSYGKDRIIVSCALEASRPRPYLDLSRSSAAHSMLCLGDRNAFSLSVLSLRGARVSVSRVLQEDGRSRLSLRHDGYRDNFGILVFRDLHLSRVGTHLLGQDRLRLCFPRVRGVYLSKIRGLRFTVRFHLHPSVRVYVLRNSREAILKPNNRPGFRFQVWGPVEMSVMDSLYGGSGSLLSTRQLVLSGLVGASIFREDFLLTWRFQHETDEET